MSSYGSGGGSRPRALYGVWINEALQSNDPEKMKEVLTAAQQQYGGGRGGQHFMPMYGVIIDRAIEGGASNEELQQLLDQAKAVQSSDLSSAISRLEAHLGQSSEPPQSQQMH